MDISTNAIAPRKLPKHQREAAAIALAANGLTKSQIAKDLNIDRKTVARYIEENKPAAETVQRAIDDLNAEIAKHIKTPDRAEKYATLAKSAKNEAVSLAALQRIDDLAGIVTEKELVRSKRNEPASPQALFMLPPGTSISFSATTVTPKVTDVIDVTPSRDAANTGENGYL